MSGLIHTSTMQYVDPSQWRLHYFGLTEERWNCLDGKTVWITGAGTGFGRSMAVALSAAGCTVFLTGRRRKKLLETLEEMHYLKIATDRCHIVVADITDVHQVKEACAMVISLSDSLYGLINNAALPSNGTLKYPLQDGTIEEWDRIMRTNVAAPWFLTKSIFPHMQKGGMARVLFITSEAGWAFTPGFGPYNISKAALNNLSVSMAEEYTARFPNIDIQINTIIPGEAKTEMNSGSIEKPHSIDSIVLILLSHSTGGPNGKFFHRDGRHLHFAYAMPYNKALI